MGGYQTLLVYRLAITIHDLTVKFCTKYIPPTSRTNDQMVQAARSGKQNIVEGSLEKSLKGYIKLLGVSRASFGELLEDYKDFIRQKELILWEKDNLQVVSIRNFRENVQDNPGKIHDFYRSFTSQPEKFANLMIVLLYKENYLLDQLIRSQEQKFITEGGYTENLFRKRLSQRNSN